MQHRCICAHSLLCRKSTGEPDSLPTRVAQSVVRRLGNIDTYLSPIYSPQDSIQHSTRPPLPQESSPSTTPISSFVSLAQRVVNRSVSALLLLSPPAEFPEKKNAYDLPMDPERDRTERNVPHLISSTSYGTDVGYLPPPYTPGQGNATATDRTPLFYTVPTTNRRQGTSSNSRASTFLRAFCAIIAWLVLLTLSGFVLYYCGLLLVWIIQYSCLLFVWIVHYCGLLFMLIVHWLGNLLSPGSHAPPERHAPPDWHAPPERYTPCPNPEKPQPDAYERRVAIIGTW